MSSQQLPLAIKHLLQRRDFKFFSECINDYQSTFRRYDDLEVEHLALVPAIKEFIKRKFNCTASITVHGDDFVINVDDDFAGSIEDELEDVLMYTNCLSWLQEKVVLHFDKTLLMALSDSELPAELPNLHLPFDRLYVQFDEPICVAYADDNQKFPPGTKVIREAHGFYTRLRKYSNGLHTITMIFIGKTSASGNVNGSLRTISEADVCAWFTVSNRSGSISRLLEESMREHANDPISAKMIRDALSMLLYLSQDADQLDIEKRTSGGKNGKVIKDNHGNPRFPNEYRVGSKIGRTLDLAYHPGSSSAGDGTGKKAVHIRRGHFAVRYFGPISAGRGRGYQKERIVWLPPTIINADQMQSETVKEVKPE